VLFQRARASVIDKVEMFTRSGKKEFYAFDPLLVAHGVSKRDEELCFLGGSVGYHVTHELRGDELYITALSPYDQYAAVSQSLDSVIWTWSDPEVSPVPGYGVTVGPTWMYASAALNGKGASGTSVEHCTGTQLRCMY
jgi:hypothetical protein